MLALTVHKDKEIETQVKYGDQAHRAEVANMWVLNSSVVALPLTRCGPWTGSIGIPGN